MSYMQWGYDDSDHNINCHSAQTAAESNYYINGQGAGIVNEIQCGYDALYHNICGPSGPNFYMQGNQNGNRFLQNQNLSVNAGYYVSPNQPQFDRGNIYYDNEGPILKNQNLFLQSSYNYLPHYNVHYHGGYPANYSAVGGHQWGYRPLDDTNQVQQISHNYHPEYNVHYHGGYPGNYSAVGEHQWGHVNSNRHQPLQDMNKVQNPLIAMNISHPKCWDPNKHMPSSDCNETQSSPTKYQQLSKYTAPAEGDRLHLINYLEYLHETPLLADQIVQNENLMPANRVVNAVDGDVNGFDANLNVIEQDDVDMDEGETKRNAITDSLIIKPKFQIGCDNSTMFVETSDCPSTKRLCCPFCDKLYIKLARHMENKHNTEEDVKKFMCLPKGSKSRLLILDSLRKTGQDNWNKSAKLNKGKMITCRRPNKKFGNKSTRFKTCPYCIGQYTRGSLRLHVRNNCPRKPIQNEEAKGKRFITALATSVEARYHENASAGLQKVYKRFRDDALVRSLKFDWLITVYGNKQAAKYTRLKSRPMIKGRLRLIARFLQELKRIEPEVKDLATLYHPKYFDRVVEAIQAVARFDVEKNEYGAPATASSCVTLVKQIGVILISEYIKRDDQELQRLTENFMTVMNIDIHNMINKTVNENQSKMRRRRVVNLPSLDDLKILNEYIQSECNVCYDELSKSFNYKKWVCLSKLTMISILIFNRKRVGDMENITLDDFHYKEEMNENTNQELFAALSDEAKNLARRYSRMRVRGKLNRTVPVLLNQTMKKCLELLVSHREDALIDTKNDHLFALQPSPIEDINYINAGTTLKKFVELSGVKNPSSINATNMRKQLATMCVSLKLDDGEVADVADFMGHAELVHRNSYRQNTIDRQVVKMSQWLEAALGNETSIDTEQRKTDDESLQKASKLLQLLDAALGDEESCDDNVCSSESSGPAQNVTMKSKVPAAAAPKRKPPAVPTMKSKVPAAAAPKRIPPAVPTKKSKRVTGRNRKA